MFDALVFQKVFELFFFNINSSLPKIFVKSATGVIKIKNIEPRTKGLITFPSTKPENIQALLKGNKIFGFTNDIIIKERLENNKNK